MQKKMKILRWIKRVVEQKGNPGKETGTNQSLECDMLELLHCSRAEAPNLHRT